MAGLRGVLKDWRVRIMIPAFFTPEVSLVMSSSLKAFAFNLRTRCLNNMLVHLTQIPLALGLGWLLDSEKLGRRRNRGLIAIGIVSVWLTGVYIAQTAWLHSWDFDRSLAGPSIDLPDSSYPGAVVIYLMYGGSYGIFQNVVLWVLGSLSNEPKKLALTGGVFVSGMCLLRVARHEEKELILFHIVLSAGTAVAFGVDATSPNYKSESGGWFAVTTLSWPILFYLAFTQISDTNYDQEIDVIAPTHIQERLQVNESQMGKA
jgi:hypothetical protein